MSSLEILEISIDWIEFTFTAFNDIDSCFRYLHIHPLEFKECIPRYGYKSALKDVEYNIIFNFNGSDSMGIHLSIAGHSIDAFCKNISDECTAMDLINLLYPVGHFTRLDIALDDIGEKYFSVNAIKRYLIQDKYVSKFKDYNMMSRRSTDGNKVIGNTIYIGRRTSNVMIRVYDKKLEHDIKLPDEEPLPYKCCRWELEIKHESAHKFADLIFKDGLSLNDAYYSVLVNYFRIINKDNGRKTRCSTLKKYSEFTNSISAASISKSKKILNIDQKRDWLLQSCSKSYALCSCGDPDFADMLFDIGYDKLTQSDLELLK